MTTASRPNANAPITLEQFYELVGDRKAELVDGVILYERMDPVSPAARRHGSISVRISSVLAAWAYPRALGELFDGATGFVLRSKPPLVRCPDVAFVAAGRLSPDDIDEPVELAPDLAVEVLSPTNTVPEMLRKLNDYLGHGVRLVWIVDPEARTIAVHAPDASPRWLTSEETLDGSDVLPGFTTPVAALFAGLAAADPRPTD
jgi:Uma2 family endonuclease